VETCLSNGRDCRAHGGDLHRPAFRYQILVMASMENIITQLEHCSPKAIHAPKSYQLKTSHVSCASDIILAFCDDDDSNTKLTTIKKIALDLGITCEEFKIECKQAQKLADQIDALNGFKPTDEQRYGIKRRVLNQRLSEAKRLFGVFKTAPDVLKEKGYAAAVVTARQWLLTNNKQWDGSAMPSEAARETKAVSKAFKAVTTANPMIAGESLKDYQSRLSPLVEAELAAQEAVANEERVNKLVKRLAENEDGDILLTACLKILESQSIVEISEAISYLSEAKMLAQYDQGVEA
jgi:hypothetical protein